MPATDPRTGAERYFAERRLDSEYESAYQDAKRQFGGPHRGAWVYWLFALGVFLGAMLAIVILNHL